MKYLFPIAFLLMIVFNIYLIHLNYNQNTHNLINNGYISDYQYLKQTNDAYLFYNNNLLNNISLITEALDSVSIEEIVYFNNTPKLVFIFSNYDCSTCVQDQLDLISKSKFTKENIYVLCNNHTEKDMNLIRRYFLKDSRINLLRIIDNYDNKINFPYYFILDSTLLMKKFFIPSKDDTTYTQQYFSAIENLL